MTTKLKKIIIAACLAIALISGGAVIISNAQSKEVYICTGPQSKRYHKEKSCIGLNSCSRRIEKVKVADAKKMRRTPCGYCY